MRTYDQTLAVGGITYANVAKPVDDHAAVDIRVQGDLEQENAKDKLHRESMVRNCIHQT